MIKCVISISTGSCFDLDLNTLESIQFLEKYSDQISGVEIVFATQKELFAFEFDEKALIFLKNCEFVSIHMPFIQVVYDNNLETKQIMVKGVSLAKQINAQYLVFHPSTVTDFNALKASVPICVENMNKKPENTGFCTVEEMKSLFEKHGFLGFVFDIAHALGNGINSSDFLVFRDRLKAIHVSGQWMKKGVLKEHGFLTEGTPEQLGKVAEVLKLNVPKIIESDFYPNKVQLIEKEVQLIREIEESGAHK